jgi:hypothetical protein
MREEPYFDAHYHFIKGYDDLTLLSMYSADFKKYPDNTKLISFDYFHDWKMYLLSINTNKNRIYLINQIAASLPATVTYKNVLYNKPNVNPDIFKNFDYNGTGDNLIQMPLFNLAIHNTKKRIRNNLKKCVVKPDDPDHIKTLLGVGNYSMPNYKHKNTNQFLPVY